MTRAFMFVGVTLLTISTAFAEVLRIEIETRSDVAEGMAPSASQPKAPAPKPKQRPSPGRSSAARTVAPAVPMLPQPEDWAPGAAAGQPEDWAPGAAAAFLVDWAPGAAPAQLED